MPDGLNFMRLDALSQDKETLTIYFAGHAVRARSGDSVAAALLAAGHSVTRTTPVSGAPRTPFCMMGVCFECLLEIDGEANCQACMVEVRDGMRIEPMAGARTAEYREQE